MTWVPVRQATVILVARGSGAWARPTVGCAPNVGDSGCAGVGGVAPTYGGVRGDRRCFWFRGRGGRRLDLRWGARETSVMMVEGASGASRRHTLGMGPARGGVGGV